MRSTRKYLAAVALAVGGMTFAPAAFGADENPSTPSANAPSANAGESTIRGSQGTASERTADVAGVRGLLAKTTDAAVQENGFRQFFSNFSSGNDSKTSQIGTAARAAGEARSGTNEANANAHASADAAQANARIEGTAGAADKAADQSDKTAKCDTKKLDEQVSEFRKNWNEKYGQAFQIHNDAIVFSDITSKDLQSMEAQPAAAEIGGSSQAGRISPSDANQGGANAAASASRNPSANGATIGQDMAPGDQARQARANAPAALSNGDRCTLNVPAFQDTTAVRVELVRDNGNYKFACSASCDCQELADNLARHLTAVNGAKAQWPADKDAASRLVTQHVLMAIQDSQRTQAQPAAAELPAHSGGDSMGGAPK